MLKLSAFLTYNLVVLFAAFTFLNRYDFYIISKKSPNSKPIKTLVYKLVKHGNK